MSEPMHEPDPTPAAGPAGLGSFANLAAVPDEEVRFCVVLNGGVSLAVWMGGTVLELDRLGKAGRGEGGHRAYELLLRLAGATVRTDVIAGTSAGGINGAALALAQVNAKANIATLRDLWIDQGQLETLLRQPFRGAPTSLMKGDEYFLPELGRALGSLAAPLDLKPPSEAPIDLTMATTVLHGNQLVTTDALGQPLPQSLHAARLRWSRWPIPERDATGKARPDPFAPGAIKATTAQLALAARASASFPVAFEPTFVPVGEDVARSARSDTDRLVRPDLTAVVASWGDARPGRDRSRYAVDGGLLANTPTAYALKAIEAMPASAPVRRVMLLVYPHAPEPGLDPADEYGEPPTMRDTMTGLLGALSAQGGRTFVEEIEAHNRRAAGRRGTRSDILLTVAADREQTLEALGKALFAHYRRLRIWRAARDLAQRKVDRHATLPVMSRAKAPSWSLEQIRFAAEQAQSWLENPQARFIAGYTVTPSAAKMVGGIPYVPAELPTEAEPDAGPGWHWGVSTAAGVAEAASDLIRRIVWLLDAGDEYDTVAAARGRVSALSAQIEDARALTDGPWDTDPVLLSLEPNQTYWAFRLGCYGVLMHGGDGAGLEELRAQIVAREGELAYAETQSGEDQQTRRDDVQRVLTERMTDVLGRPGTAGAVVRELVMQIVAEVDTVLPVLRRIVDDTDEREAAIVGDGRLAGWRVVLAGGSDPVDTNVLLTRLLQLEVASTALGDELATGSTNPVELVQLSAQTTNGFTRYTHTADDKLGGWSIKRFGGFLKRSWRLNDWMWGRLDAATVLTLTILQPKRVRRAATLAGYLGQGTPDELARATVDDVVTQLFADSPAAQDARVLDLRRRAVDELAAVFAVSTVPSGDLPTSMPALAGLFAWAIHLDVIPEDLPALVKAIKGDAVDGSNARSRGQFFLQQNDALLSDVVALVDRDGATAVPAADRVALLAAFDRAGIGRESLAGETSSDLLLRSATTAAAVGATAVDSPRSGLGAIRPVTRALRGGMLVVYWAMTGLTAKAIISRSLALLGLALGGVLLVLAAFGALPSAVSAPAASIGISLLLLAFAYGALRSGTMLHGLVLLTPVVPLIADAIARVTGGGNAADATARHGVVVVAAIVLLALGLMVLGTLPAAGGSPYAALGTLATRMGVPPSSGHGKGTLGHLAEGTVRRFKGLGLLIGNLGWRLAVAVLPVLLAIWVGTTGWGTAYEWLHAHWVIFAIAAALTAVAGFLLAGVMGFALQGLVEDRTGSTLAWQFPRVDHAAGVQAGWSALYGAAYLAGATFLVIDPNDWRRELWCKALCLLALVLGVVLSLVVPVAGPLMALSSIGADERLRARSTPVFVADATDYDGGGPAQITPSHAYALDLLHRDRAFRWWVSYDAAKSDSFPVLKPRGAKLLKQLDEIRKTTVG